MNQKIKEERMNIDIVDRMKQIEIQENEIERRRKELGRQRSSNTYIMQDISLMSHNSNETV